MTPGPTAAPVEKPARRDAARAHGGPLVQRWVPAEEGARELDGWRGAARLRLAPHQLSEAVQIACGAYSPLRGFLGARDYASVVAEMRLDSGVLWPIPVTLTVTADHPLARSAADVVPKHELTREVLEQSLTAALVRGGITRA